MTTRVDDTGKYVPEILALYKTARFQKLLELLNTQTSGRLVIYGVKMNPTLPVTFEYGIVSKGTDEDAEFKFRSRYGEIMFTPRRFTEAGELVMSVAAYKEMAHLVSRIYSSGDSISNEDGLRFLGEEIASRHRVVVILPVRPGTVKMDSSIVENVLETVGEKLGASVLVAESEPSRGYRDSTEIMSVMSEAMLIARRFLEEHTPGDARTLVVVPTDGVLSGKYDAEQLKKTLYDTIVNRKKTGVWLSVDPNIRTEDVMEQAGFKGDVLRCRVVLRSDVIRDENSNGSTLMICRFRVVGAVMYPSGYYALYPSGEQYVMDMGTLKKTLVDAKVPKPTIQKILPMLPRNIWCYSKYHRQALVGKLYQICRLSTSKVKTDAPRSAIELFRKIVSGGVIVCGTPVREDEMPSFGSGIGGGAGRVGDDVAQATDGKYLRSLAGSVGYLGDGRRVGVVAEDVVSGLAFVLPLEGALGDGGSEGGRGKSVGALLRDGFVVPLSFIYAPIKEESSPKVTLPTGGLHEYLSVWMPSKDDPKRMELPEILERCFFCAPDGSCQWRNRDGSVSLQYSVEGSYRGWLLSVGGKTLPRSAGASGSGASTWCGAYGDWMVAPRIGDPLEAIAVQSLRATAGSRLDILKRVIVDAPSVEIAEDLLGGFSAYRSPDQKLAYQTYVEQLPSTTLVKSGVPMDATTDDERDKFIKSFEKRGIQNVRSSEFSKYFRNALSSCEDEFARRLGFFAVYPSTLRHRGMTSSKMYSEEIANLEKIIKETPKMVGSGLRYLIEETDIQNLGKTIFRSSSPAKLVYYREGAAATTMRFATAEEQALRIPLLTSSTNPTFRKMDHFVSFAADESQIVSFGLQAWARGGAPLLKYDLERGGGALKPVFAAIDKATTMPQYVGVNREDVVRGIQYAFHKLRIGLFVSIRNNSMVVFCPMVNAGYENAYPRTDEFWFGEGMTEKEYLGSKNAYLKLIDMRPEAYEPRNRWFANNSLIGNMISPNFTGDQTMPVVFDILRETIKNRKIGDCDFLVNTRDFPKLRKDGKDPDHAVYGLLVDNSMPMFGFQSRRRLPVIGFNIHPQYLDVGIPVPDDWKNACGGYYGKDERGSDSVNVAHPLPITDEQWAKRKPGAIFRGSATGVGSLAPMNQRVLLAEMVARDHIPEGVLNVGIISGAIRDRKTGPDGMKYLIAPGKGEVEEVEGSLEESEIEGNGNDFTEGEFWEEEEDGLAEEEIVEGEEGYEGEETEVYEGEYDGEYEGEVDIEADVQKFMKIFGDDDKPEATGRVQIGRGNDGPFRGGRGGSIRGRGGVSSRGGGVRGRGGSVRGRGGNVRGRGGGAPSRGGSIRGRGGRGGRTAPRRVVVKATEVKAPNTIATIEKDKRMPLRSPLLKDSLGKWNAPEEYTAQDSYQMVVYVDGNAAAYRYSSLMAGAFVILRVASRVGYEMWFYAGLRNALPGSTDPAKIREYASMSPDEFEKVIDPEGDHIMIDSEMETLLSVIELIGKHPKIGLRIATNSVRRYNEMFTKDALMDVTSRVINGLSRGQVWENPYSVAEMVPRLVEEPAESKMFKHSMRLQQKRQEVQRELQEKIEAGETKEDEVVEEVGLTEMVRPDVVLAKKTTRMDVPQQTIKAIVGKSFKTKADLPDPLPEKPGNVIEEKPRRRFVHGALQTILNRGMTREELEN